MALLRGYAKVDEEGKIPIPKNIRIATDYRPGQLVEIKVTGPIQAQYITIHKRKAVR